MCPAGVRENHSRGELDMPMKRYKAEQIVTLLRQIEVGIANGKPTPQACKEGEITIQTYYRWRKEFGGLKLDCFAPDLLDTELSVFMRRVPAHCARDGEKVRAICFS